MEKTLAKYPMGVYNDTRKRGVVDGKDKKSCCCGPRPDTCPELADCPERAQCPEREGKAEQEGCEKTVCCHKKKQRSEKEYRDLLNRLSRIEGQVRGIRKMVESDAYCPIFWCRCPL